MAESHSARQRKEKERLARMRGRMLDEAVRTVRGGQSYRPAVSRSTKARRAE